MQIYTGSNQRIPEFHSWALLCKGMGITSYVELGSGSAWSIRDACPDAKFITVDLLPNGLGGIDHVQGNSQDYDTRTIVIAKLGMMPDVVFIDADHTYEGCKRDFEVWYPVAQVAVAFHDTFLQEGCDRFWREVSKQYPSVEIIGRDHASAVKWQGSHNDGHVNAGGIGVIYKI